MATVWGGTQCVCLGDEVAGFWRSRAGSQERGPEVRGQQGSGLGVSCLDPVRLVWELHVGRNAPLALRALCPHPAGFHGRLMTTCHTAALRRGTHTGVLPQNSCMHSF